MGDGQHKIKRKAEQMACEKAINAIKNNTDTITNNNTNDNDNKV
jgi:hypothetical protein